MRSLLAAFGRQNWIRFGVRNRVIRLFDHPDRARDEWFERAFFGRRYRGNFNTFIDWSVFYFGAYAWEELVCMRDALDGCPQAVVVDVGANVGHHTLFASTVASKVHAFEPFPPLAERIWEKIRMNHLQSVTVHPIGLGNVNARLAYSPPSTTNSGTGSFRFPESGTVDLEVRRGDDYFREAGIERIDYLKIDVEGFEVEVLQGLSETLHRTRPTCFIEWSQAERPGVSGPDLFPPDYLFYRFFSNEPRWILFNGTLFRLGPIHAPWPNAHVLATPREFWRGRGKLTGSNAPT